MVTCNHSIFGSYQDIQPIIMMKIVRSFIVSILFTFLFLSPTHLSAQCAMCTLNAENSVKEGNTQGSGLNSAILYLLAAPYIAVGLVGFIWYRNYRRKKISTDL